MHLKPWVVWMAITIIIWGIAAFIRKPVAQSLSPASALMAELVGGALAVALIGFVFREQVLGTKMPGTLYAVLVGFLAAGGTIFLYRALKEGPVSIITPLAAISALIPVLLGLLILHERISFAQSAGIFLAIVAAALLSL